MRKLKLLIVCTIIIGFILSCEKDKLSNQVSQQVVIEPTKAQLNKLYKMGINIDNVTIENIQLLDGITQKYLVSGDITIPVDNLENHANLETLENSNKQYQTPNIVASQDRNIKILGYTGENFALTPKMQTALSWAVFNYNSLSNTLNFKLTYGSNTETADIIVYKVTGEAGGSAGFPTITGKPYRYIRVNSKTDDMTTNVNEHVISHEIAHCLGIRHQDWFNRQSCNNSEPLINESPKIMVAGTSVSFIENSIMLTCFGPNQDGEFTASDKEVINLLYRE